MTHCPVKYRVHKWRRASRHSKGFREGSSFDSISMVIVFIPNKTIDQWMLIVSSTQAFPGYYLTVGRRSVQYATSLT